jgi:hypothetical protein
MSANDIKLGNKVEDIVTSFVGIAVNRLEHMDGRIEYGVQPSESKDGKRPGIVYLPSSQLILLDEGITVNKIKPVLGFHSGSKKVVNEN